MEIDQKKRTEQAITAYGAVEHYITPLVLGSRLARRGSNLQAFSNVLARHLNRALSCGAHPRPESDRHAG